MGRLVRHWEIRRRAPYRQRRGAGSRAARRHGDQCHLESGIAGRQGRSGRVSFPHPVVHLVDLIFPANRNVLLFSLVALPAQAIFYDQNKFPALKGKFLVVSYAERSIHAITLNSNGSISDELAIRLPGTRGHLVSIAQTPERGHFLWWRESV